MGQFLFHKYPDKVSHRDLCATLCVFVHREEERPDIELLRRVHLLLGSLVKGPETKKGKKALVLKRQLKKELLNCKEESQRLNEMMLTTKTTNGLSKCESCPEKGKLEKSMNNVIHKENRD
ncbi:hypothetical protein F8M41_026107 [Gigaspora margarita]|uniref:Uncharacterized protein n=1 Tax=Gigaspora margarita TaxID=4874 RepID=A0A8H4AZU2_GIGMA|nr:hypothetical protein F8M41_026107 [Gigaspora margarita]